MINFCVEKIFVGTTPYHVNINSAHAFFIRLIFIAAIDNKNFQIYGIYFQSTYLCTVYCLACLRACVVYNNYIFTFMYILLI